MTQINLWKIPLQPVATGAATQVVTKGVFQAIEGDVEVEPVQVEVLTTGPTAASAKNIGSTKPSPQPMLQLPHQHQTNLWLLPYHLQLAHQAMISCSSQQLEQVYITRGHTILSITPTPMLQPHQPPNPYPFPYVFMSTPIFGTFPRNQISDKL